jgi:multiple sugar transport system substrate-binding protein
MIFWVLSNSGFQTEAHLKSVLRKFKETHPKIKIDIKVLTREALWKNLFLCQKKSPDVVFPDLVQFPHYTTALFADLDLLQNLGNLDKSIHEMEWIDKLKPHCYLPNTRQIYSVPWWTHVSALHYNLEHVRQVSSNPDKDLKTWNGMLKVCQLLKNKFNSNKGYYPIANSNLRGTVSMLDMIPFLWGNGGGLFSDDFKEVFVNKKETIETIHSFLALFENGYMSLMMERGLKRSQFDRDSSMTFSSRINRVAASGELNYNAVKTTLMPEGKKSSCSLLYSFNLAIMRESPNIEEAFTLLKWLIDEENQYEYAKLTRSLPCSKRGFERFIEEGDDKTEIYRDLVNSSKTIPNVMISGTCLEILDKVLDACVNKIKAGDYSVDFLKDELMNAQIEIEYLHSLYGDN